VNSRQPDDPPVLFIDRNLGRYVIADALRTAGIRCVIHDDYLPPDAPDEEWLSLVGRNGWVAITRDKNIRYRSPEKIALQRASARLIVIRAKQTTAQDIAVLLTTHIKRIFRFCDKHDAPFIAGITRDGKLTEYQL
jgi:predicted nuclease of predicted toxin-antitoxin system